MFNFVLENRNCALHPDDYDDEDDREKIERFLTLFFLFFVLFFINVNYYKYLFGHSFLKNVMNSADSYND